MMFELSQLPMVIQNQITEAKAPVEIVNNGQVVATLNPTAGVMTNVKKVPNSAYDYVMSLDMDERVADIEFDLPELETQSAVVLNKKQSLYDIFANADPAVADIDFELPKRTISNRPIPFEDE